MIEMFQSINSVTDVLVSMGVMGIPTAILLIFVNHRVRVYEKKCDLVKEEERQEREDIKQKAIDDAAEVRRLSIEHAKQIKEEAKSSAAERTQEMMCIIRAIRDTGELTKVLTVATKAQANGEKPILNGNVDKALNQYDNTMKDLDEFLMIKSTKYRY